MKKITGSLLVCAGAGVFSATALLVGPVASKQPTPIQATVPAASSTATPPATASDGGPVGGGSHTRHGSSADGASGASGSDGSSGSGPAGPTSRDAGPSAAAGVTATLRISGFAFETQPVSPGATVTVTNTDQAPHTVTAEDGSFSASVAPGGTTTFVAPDRAGSFAFFCEVHPQMTATLTVR